LKIPDLETLEYHQKFSGKCAGKELIQNLCLIFIKAFWRYANTVIKVKASIPTLTDESLDSMEATSM